MPNLNVKETSYKPPKTLQLDWDSFRGGLNTQLRQTEIKDNELAQATNLVLVGMGVPTKRNGTANYFLTAPSVATGSQKIRGLKGVLFASGASGVNELLALSDWGILVKKNGASYSPIMGASYASGYNADMVQIFNNIYIVNGSNNLTKYNGASIYSFTQLSRPTGVQVTNLSGVSGTFTRSFRISAFNAVGETIASDAVLVSNTPQDLTNTTLRINWTTSSPASYVLGYGVYGFDQGDERLITTVDSSTLRYDYQGIPDPSQLVFPASADTTLGPIAKFAISYKDKLVLGNVDGYPSRITWSGGGANVDKFNWRYGGGYVDIDKDAGDFITGLIEFQESIIVFKQRSIWKVTLATQDALVIPTVTLIIRGVGAASHRSIKHVENDVFFLTRRGVYSLGNEAQYIGNVLRTNELSAKIRPLFQTLTSAQLAQSCAVYQENKYRLSYPVGGDLTNSQEVIYDRERLAWMGPNTYPATPAVYEVYYDGDNKENLVWGDSNDNFVTYMSSGISNDKGIKIQTSLLTKKTALKNPFRFKQFKTLYTNWRNVFGTPFVNIILETRDGAASSAQSFTISASNAGTGWGFDRWGTFKWGDTSGAGNAAGSNDLAKRTRINKVGRTIQCEVTTTGNNDKYELLSVQIIAQELGEGIIPSSWDTA
jgi:hypothetical protein